MKRLTRSQILLLELTLNLLFFCVCAAVCMALLARAHVLSRDSAALGQQMILAQNAAEVYQSADGDLSQTGKLLGANAENGVLRLAYDAEGLCMAAEQKPAFDQHGHMITEGAAYQMVVSSKEQDGLNTAVIEVRTADAEEQLYELTVACAAKGAAK